MQRIDTNAHLGHDGGREMDSNCIFGSPLMLDRMRPTYSIKDLSHDNDYQGMHHRVGAKLAGEVSARLQSSRHKA